MDTSKIKWVEQDGKTVGTIDISKDLYVRARISSFCGSPECDWEVIVFKRSPLIDDALFILDQQVASKMKEAKTAVRECLEYLDEQVTQQMEMKREEIDGLQEILDALNVQTTNTNP